MTKRRRKKISSFTEMVHEINANQFFDKPLELKEGKQTYAKWEEKTLEESKALVQKSKAKRWWKW